MKEHGENRERTKSMQIRNRGEDKGGTEREKTGNIEEHRGSRVGKEREKEGTE